MLDRIPQLGDVVIYTLCQGDVDAINAARATRSATPANLAHRSLPLYNAVSAGQEFPMVITRVWGGTTHAAVNGQVLLDGADTLWVTSRMLGGKTHGTFRFRERSTRVPLEVVADTTKAVDAIGRVSEAMKQLIEVTKSSAAETAEATRLIAEVAEPRKTGGVCSCGHTAEDHPCRGSDECGCRSFVYDAELTAKTVTVKTSGVTVAEAFGSAFLRAGAAGICAPKSPPTMRAGSVVRLKSGGPVMTIERVLGRDGCKCVWYDAHTEEFVRSGVLLVDTLEAVSPQ